MSGNPFATLNKVLALVDEDTRKASRKCPRCGLDRGGIMPTGQTKQEAGICDCALGENPEGDGHDAGS